MKKILLLMVPVLLLSGCALGTRRPMLNYSIIFPSAAKNNIVVKVSDFNDERTWSKAKIGDVKGGFGNRCGEIIPQNSVTVWIKEALKKELNNAGYTISDDASVNNIIGGDVLEVYTDAYWNYGGRVRLKIVLKKDGEEVLAKEYSAEKNCGMQWAATAASFGKTMELTLQDVMKQVLPDINKALLKNTDVVE